MSIMWLPQTYVSLYTEWMPGSPCPEPVHIEAWNYLLSSVWNELPASVRLYADNPMWRASDSPPATIPTNISTTRARPDIVLIEDTSVNILEPTNTREALQATRKRKSGKPLYNFRLINDLEDRGLLIGFIQNSGNWLPWSLAIWTMCHQMPDL